MKDQVTKTSKFIVGDRVEATDHDGNFHREKGTVVGFRLNWSGRLLVDIQRDNGISGRTSCFYVNELMFLERPADPVPR